MSLSRLGWVAWAGVLTVCACDAPRVTPETHGVSVQPGPCGRGLVVIESDYQSTNVSLMGFDGSLLSPSFASSNTVSSGFGVSLSSDVVVPSSAQLGSNIALIDSYPAGVLRFVDLSSAHLSAELSVATGFKSNPHDYLALSEQHAYVARYQANKNPGREPFDQGADILVVDPSVPSIVSRIDLAPALAGESTRFSAHPGRLLRVGERVFALLAAYADDKFTASVSSRLVELDPNHDTLLTTLVLDGLHGCDSLALSPDALELAVGCTGDDWEGRPPRLAGSGLALVDITAQPRLSKVVAAAEVGNTTLGFSLSYAAQNALVFGTLGYLQESGTVGAPDALLVLDTKTGQATTVLRSESQPFTLGSVLCAPTCGVCFATDAERAGGSVLRFPIDAAGVPSTPSVIRVETRIGLPPRYLGAF